MLEVTMGLAVVWVLALLVGNRITFALAVLATVAAAVLGVVTLIDRAKDRRLGR